jgi:hypothetical protein
MTVPRLEDEQGPSREELTDLYKIAVEEYRFQVTLNWDRAKYLLGFNTAVITVGTGLVKLGEPDARLLVAGIFVVGLVSALLSAAAAYLQHGYYQTTRDHMTSLAARLKLDDAAVTTTPGARGARRTVLSRLGKVQNVLYTLLLVCSLVNVLGLGYVLSN